MTPSSLAAVVVALVIGWALFQVRTRGAYSCPACGSMNEDGHAEDCPWSRLP
jgi:hypothetical protein